MIIAGILLAITIAMTACFSRREIIVAPQPFYYEIPLEADEGPMLVNEPLHSAELFTQSTQPNIQIAPEDRLYDQYAKRPV